MLETLRDYPYYYIKLLYKDMGDGILSGLNITLEDDNFYIHEGIFKINGEIYFLTKTFCMEVLKGIHYVYLTVLEHKKVDGIEYEIQIKQEQAETKDSFELFRYIKSLKILEYQSIDEIFLKSIMNRIDRTHVKQSIIGGSTLCSEYFKFYANAILENKNACMTDIAFAYQCLNGINDIHLLKNYFQSDSLTNEEILSKMKDQLDSLEELKSQENKIKNTNIEKPKKSEHQIEVSR